MIVRKPNLEVLTSEGIPKDFADVREYFNEGLFDDSQPWIPRKRPITNKEIRELWVPSANTNITYVAELNGQVIGSMTVFYNPGSTAYEHADKRVMGEMSGTTATKIDRVEVIKEITPCVVNELKRLGKTAMLRTAIESHANEAMKRLGYQPARTEFAERYKREGISGSVNIYEFP